MAGVSQALIEYANHRRPAPTPGVEIIDTERYRITLQPDWPVAGPNAVSWIRCNREEAKDVIAEIRAVVRPRRLPLMWTLDPETEPADFAAFLAEHDVHPAPSGAEVAVMVLPCDADLNTAHFDGLGMEDALANSFIFRAAVAANDEAFGNETHADARTLEQRRRNFVAAGNKYLLLASVDGEPAGSGSLTVDGPEGAAMNGGAVRPKFRGRGIYRALVAARLQIARDLGAAGLAVWGGPMSAPILERLGFTKVGWRRFYLDTTTS